MEQKLCAYLAFFDEKMCYSGDIQRTARKLKHLPGETVANTSTSKSRYIVGKYVKIRARPKI